MQVAVATQLTTTPALRVAVRRARIGWTISGLVAAFLAFDAFAKFAKPAPVVEAFARTGWPLELASTLGVILAVSTVLFLISRTAPLGAILLTGYLGGAVATNLRLENPLMTHTLFPVYFGVLIWIGLWLRDGGVQSLVVLTGSKTASPTAPSPSPRSDSALQRR